MQAATCIILVALTIAGCAGSHDGKRSPGDFKPAPEGKDFVLGIHREIRVDALLRIGFMDVLGDSRCPTTVQCPWMGDGAVEIAIALGEGPSYPDTLHTTLDPKGVGFGGYRITLRDLMPYPYDTNPIPLDEYAVRLRVEPLKP